jgi:hypothetical protein
VAILMKKSENMSVWLSKKFAQFVEAAAGYWVIWLLLPVVSDYPTIMIGPGGLLLVVSHLFACSPGFLVLWVGLNKRQKKTKLGCEKQFFSQGHILGIFCRLIGDRSDCCSQFLIGQS